MQAGSTVRSYLLYIILAIIGYALIAGGLAILFRNASLFNNPLLIGAFVIALTLLFNPFRKQLQQSIDRVFFSNQVTQQDHLASFNRELSQVNKIQKIVALLRMYIYEGVHPSAIHIFLHDSQSDQYIAAIDEKGIATTDLRFPGDSQLSKIAQGRSKLFHLDDPDNLKKVPHSSNPASICWVARYWHFYPERMEWLAGWF